MTNPFLQTLTGLKGRLITIFAGVLAGLVARGLARAGFDPDPQTLNDITNISGAAVTFGIEWMFSYLQTKGVKQIQEALPPEIKVDGVPGEKTVQAVEVAVAQASENQNTPPP